MRDGRASVTAQRVAAHRLTFDRVPAPYGDPAADVALARDVAAAAAPEPGPMREYLRARTRFFDGAVTDAVGRGCPQVVIGAAGYDGRALRYAKPGVLWFEVDHPATQRDKRSRLARLGIGGRHICAQAGAGVHRAGAHVGGPAANAAGPAAAAAVETARRRAVLGSGGAGPADLYVQGGGARGQRHGGGHRRFTRGSFRAETARCCMTPSGARR